MITRAERNSGSTNFRTLYTACVVTENYKDALRWIEQAVADTPRDYLAWAELANVLGHLERLDDARSAIEQVKAIVPTWTLAMFEKGTRLAWRNKDDVVEPQLAGLRKLGLE